MYCEYFDFCGKGSINFFIQKNGEEDLKGFKDTYSYKLREK